MLSQGETRTTPALLDIARHWLSMGVTPIPVAYRSKRPLVAWGYWQKHAPVDYHLREWFGGDDVNLGLLCGGPSRLCVLDFDRVVDYYRWKHDNEDNAHTYTVRTSRGMHVYFQTEETPQTAIADGILIKGEGGYVLAPPSVHPSGHTYRALNGDKIVTVPSIADIMANVETETTKIAVSNPSGEGSMIGWIKDNVSLVRLVSRYTQTKPTSPDLRWWMARCPFHDDHNPSFWIDNRLGICNCFRPDCQTPRAMDAINFYARIEGVSNDEAIARLYDKLI